MFPVTYPPSSRSLSYAHLWIARVRLEIDGVYEELGQIILHQQLYEDVKKALLVGTHDLHRYLPLFLFFLYFLLLERVRDLSKHPVDEIA